MGKCALLWVSFARDLPFFEISARSYSKFARGFDYAKVVVPTQDVEAFKRVSEPHGITVAGFDEWPEKGQLHHQAMKCFGDIHFPDDAEFIFHMDSDSTFWQDIHTSQFFQDGKPFLCFHDFSIFLDQPLVQDEQMTFMGFTGRRIDFNRGQYFWKFAADFALGFEVQRETMAGMPIVHLRETYAKTREVIASRFATGFEGYVRNCRNEFPQTFCEFNTLGGVAHKFFDEKYSWFNLYNTAWPFPPALQSWSHGGFDSEHDNNYPAEVGGKQTPRQLYTRLGLM